jgi:flagellar assembly factor FliW
MSLVQLNMLGYLGKNQKKKIPYKNLISNRGFSEKMFYFPDGLPGFKDNKEFAFVFNDKSNPFIIMNFCGETKLSFMCIDPFFIFKDYKPTPSEEDKMALNASSSDDLVFLTIVKVDKGNIAKGVFSEGVIIIKSPLVINPKNNYGKQILIDNPDYLEPYTFKDIKKFE